MPKDDAEKFRADLMETVSGINTKVDKIFEKVFPKHDDKENPKRRKTDKKDDKKDDSQPDDFGFTLLG